MPGSSASVFATHISLLAYACTVGSALGMKDAVQMYGKEDNSLTRCTPIRISERYKERKRSNNV